MRNAFADKKSSKKGRAQYAQSHLTFYTLDFCRWLPPWGWGPHNSFTFSEQGCWQNTAVHWKGAQCALCTAHTHCTAGKWISWLDGSVTDVVMRRLVAWTRVSGSSVKAQTPVDDFCPNCVAHTITKWHLCLSFVEHFELHIFWFRLSFKVHVNVKCRTWPN